MPAVDTDRFAVGSKHWNHFSYAIFDSYNAILPVCDDGARNNFGSHS